MNLNHSTIQNDLDTFCDSRCTRVCDTYVIKQTANISDKSLTIITANVRSIHQNFDKFLVFVASLNIDIDLLVLTECWTDDCKPPPSLANYQTFLTKRALNQNDGVVVYVREGIRAIASEPIIQDGNCLVLNIQDNCTVICSYRPPCFPNPIKYLDSLDTLLQSIKSKTIVLTGDININILPENITNHGLHYISLMAYHGLLQGVDKATRDKSCIDHFMVKTSLDWQTFVFDPLTDHSPVLLVVNDANINKLTKNHKKIITNYDAIRKQLADENWDEYYLLDDANKAAYYLISKLQYAIDCNSHEVELPHRKKCLKPWITLGILRSIKKRNWLQRQSKRSPNDVISKSVFIAYRNRCNNLIKTLKAQYYRNKFVQNSGNSKKTWDTIKDVCNLYSKRTGADELLHAKSTVTESLDLVNEYFTSIGLELANITLTKLGLDENTLARNTKPSDSPPGSFSCSSVDCFEVHEIILGLRSNCASGWDNITTNIVKKACPYILQPLTHLINLSLDTGIFPEAFKQAIVTPIYKTGLKMLPTNYRPISLLTTFSKILEKIVNKRLMDYLEKNSLLSPRQFGFRLGKSTEDAVLELTAKVRTYLDNDERCLGVFLDLQKAFDTVSIPILLKRIEHLGVRGVPLSWFHSYLEGRSQRIRINEHVSNDSDCVFGVPQGSTLGPTLFLIYVNQICNLNIASADIIMFADDTVLLFHGPDWNQTRLLAEAGMSRVVAWLEDSLLNLNTTKTNYICFSISDRTSPKNFKLQLHTYPCNRNPCITALCSCGFLTRVHNMKYLGVIVDENLSWGPQITAVAKRTRKLIYVFKNLRGVAPPDILCLTYKSLAESILLYCICAWGTASKTSLIEIERAQRAVLKVLMGLPFRYPTEDLFKICDVLSVRKLFIYQSLRRYHRYTVPFLTLPNRRVCKVPLPKCRTVFAMKSHDYYAPMLYNKLNRNVKEISKLSNNMFKNIILSNLKELDYETTENLFVRLQ